MAISEAVKHDVLRYVQANTRIEVVPNGVLPRARYEELRQVMMERWAQLSPFRFVQVGLIHPGKGQVEAVEALAQVRVRFPQATLVIAGTGRDKPLRQRISELGLEGAVELAGFVDDVPALLKRCHVLLSTSRDEAFGRTVVEASGLRPSGDRARQWRYARAHPERFHRSALFRWGPTAGCGHVGDHVRPGGCTGDGASCPGLRGGHLQRGTHRRPHACAFLQAVR
ncbi:MAG: glycosyltransferase [Flavobacteriales bacterium]|nr:glycosyltransferase [Flavobacteriales bacterium]